jgi:hypothetical protein
MSTTLTTAQMVAEIQHRMPYSIPSQICMDRLNSAYRWLETQGSFVWNLLYTTLTVSANALTVDLPVDFNPLKEAVITTAGGGLRLQYVPAEDFLQYRTAPSTTTTGVFSVWTFVWVTGTPPKYVVHLGPDAAKNATGTTSLELWYHRQSPTPLVAGSYYYPTPNECDDLIVDMAEGEMKRIYGIAGWDVIIQKARDMAMRILDQGRSTKTTEKGLVDTTRKAQEKQAQRSIGQG